MISILRQIASKWHQRRRWQPASIIKKLGDNVTLARFGNHRYVVKEFVSQAAFNHEQDILRCVRDVPKCARLVAAADSCLILPYYAGGDLCDYYRWHPAEFTVAAVARIICQLCDALQGMHERGVYHLDLKLENICLVEDKLADICLIDFGAAVLLDEQPLRSITSTRSYISPEFISIQEALDKDESVSKQQIVHIDTWSVGVIAFSLLCGEYPFKGMTVRGVEANIMRLRYAFPKRASVPEEIRQMIAAIFVIDGQQRPTLEAIRNLFAKYSEKKYKSC